MKKKVIFTFILFIIIVLSSQIIFHFDIKRQYYDAEIINKTGKQRMFSQKLTKIALLANNAINTDEFLSKINDFEESFKNFTDGNHYINNIDLDFYESPYLVDLYKTNNLYFSILETASLAIINDAANQETFRNNLKVIINNEEQFLNSMDKIVNEYQKISERKISNFEKIQLFYNLGTLVLLFYVLFFIIIPLFKLNGKFTGKIN